MSESEWLEISRKLGHRGLAGLPAQVAWCISLVRDAGLLSSAGERSRRICS